MQASKLQHIKHWSNHKYNTQALFGAHTQIPTSTDSKWFSVGPLAMSWFATATPRVSQMIHELQWPSLESRRKMQRLSMMHKIRHGLVILDNSECRLIPSAKRLRTGHDQSYDIDYSGANYHQYSYVPRTIRDWIVLRASGLSALFEPVQGALVGLKDQLIYKRTVCCTCTHM